MSATTRVVRVPELVSRIFSFSTTEDNGQNLLVCKLWSNEVLNIEWKVVTDATYLFHVLAPLEWPESQTTGLICFTRQLTPEDWIRFDRYAWRITSLDVSLSNIDISLYGEIAASRNRLDFLPNLCTLSIPGITIAVQLFAHANVTSFTVCPPYTPDHDIDIDEIKGTLLLSLIRHRMPNLRSLSIDVSSPYSTDEIQSEATLTLASLKKLSHLVLPPAWITDCVTKTISELPNLHTLDSNHLGLADPSKDLDTPLFSTDLTASSFPKLNNLVIWISYPRAVACFSQAFRLASLKVLELYATNLTTREELKHLIVIIGSSCPRLTGLRLGDGWGSFYSEDVPEGLGLEFQDLEPLISCKYLARLCIVHGLPFFLSTSDVVKLLKHFKWLTALYLNAMPSTQSPSSLPISCLSSIASVCPSLSTLGLYISTSPSDVPTTDSMATFASLQCLNVGYSKLEKEDIEPVAFYLGHILPRDCKVSSFNIPVRDPVLQQQGSPSVAHWREVCRLAPMFRQAFDNREQHILSGLK